MGLTVRRLKFVDFRNYRELDLDGLGKLTVFVGPNAVGKTNIIEGIQLLTAQTSFRKPMYAQMVRQGATFARLDAWVSDDSRDLQLTLQLAEGKRKRLMNGKAKRAADLRGIVPSVAFTPDDLELARSASSPRRDALDALGSQLSASHHRLCSDYEKALKNKNRLLKDEAPDPLIESIDEIMVLIGAQLTCYRTALFSRLAKVMGDCYREISGGREELQASYTPSWIDHDPESICSASPTRDDARAALQNALVARRDEERARRRSVIGPHADHLDFFIDGRNAAHYGSQGQRRSLVLAFKLAETALIEDLLGQKPVLLLDDVMGELDAARRTALLTFALEGLQTFITATGLHYFDESLVSRADVVELSEAKREQSLFLARNKA